MDNLNFTVTSKVKVTPEDNSEYLYEMEAVTIFCELSEDLTRQMFSDCEPIKQILIDSLVGKVYGTYQVKAECVIIFDLANTEHNATFRKLNVEVTPLDVKLH